MPLSSDTDEMYGWFDYRKKPLILNEHDIAKRDFLTDVVTYAIDTNEERYGKKRTRKRKTEDENNIKEAVEVIITNLLFSYDINPKRWLKFYKNRNQYGGKNPQIPKDFSLIFASQILNFLLDLGFIEQMNGYYDKSSNSGDLTRIRATDKFNESFKAHIKPEKQFFQSLEVKSPKLLKSYVRVRETVDYHFNYKAFEQGRIKIKKEKKEYTPKPKNPALKAQLKSNNLELVRINRHLDNDFIDILLPDDLYITLNLDVTKKHYYRLYADNEMTQGGRLYRTWWQNIPSKYRPYITINFHKTVELDYSSLHPTILYLLTGKELPKDKDLYTIPCIEGLSNPQYRKTVKRIFNAMLNAKRDVQPEDTDLLPKGMTHKDMIKAIKEHYNHLEDYFFTGYGLTLQKIDSEIAYYLHQRMNYLDIEMLSIHDSFIVVEDNEEALREAMIKMFNHIMKSHGINIPEGFEIGISNQTEKQIDKLKSEGLYFDYPEIELKESMLKKHGNTHGLLLDVVSIDKELSFSKFKERANQWLDMCDYESDLV